MTQPQTAADPYRCICPSPPRAVRDCPAHKARYAAQQAGPDPEPVEPVPLPALHLQAQEIRCCVRPMRLVSTRTSWTGQPTTGTEVLTSTRKCTNCGAILTLTTVTPS